MEGTYHPWKHKKGKGPLHHHRIRKETLNLVAVTFHRSQNKYNGFHRKVKKKKKVDNGSFTSGSWIRASWYQPTTRHYYTWRICMSELEALPIACLDGNSKITRERISN